MRSLLLLFILTACAPIQIKDYTMYGDEGKFGAVEEHTLLTNIPPKQIDKGPWDDMRIGMVCTAANNIADIQATVDKLCNRHPNECDYQTQARIKNAKTSMYMMLAAMKRKGLRIDDNLMRVFWTAEGERLDLLLP